MNTKLKETTANPNIHIFPNKNSSKKAKSMIRIITNIFPGHRDRLYGKNPESAVQSHHTGHL